MRTSAWDLQDVDLVSEAGLFPFLPPVSPTPSLPQHDWTSPSWVEDARDVRPRSPGMFPAQMPRSLPASPLPLSASPPAAAIAANTIAAASAAPPSSIALALPAHPAVWYPSPALAQATDGKKAKHRAIDAKRRNLETEAMQVLQKLVPGISATSGLRSSSVPVPKVALLRACADYIRQLQGLVHQHPDQSESDSTTSTRLAPDRKRQRLDPPEGSDHLARIEESHVLRNEMFVSAAVLLCCMDLTGRWLDVNERWLQRLCWSRDDVTGRFGSPIAAYMPFITQHPQAQMSFPSSELVRFHGGCSKGFEYVQHDAMTISQLRSLFQGLQKVTTFVDGFVMGCGKFIEIRWNCWLVERNQQPRYFVLSAPDSAIMHVSCTYKQAMSMARDPCVVVTSGSDQQATPNCVPSVASTCINSSLPSTPLSPGGSLYSAVDGQSSRSPCRCCVRCSCSNTAPCGCDPPSRLSE